MLTIEEIRKKYPQYNDLSDEQLLEGFHRKFYSDIPREEFFAMFIPQQPTSPMQQPESSSWGDKLRSFTQSPLATGFRTGVERTTQGILQGLLPESQALKNIANEREAKYAQAYENNPYAALAGNIVGGVGSTLPTALAGGAVASRAAPLAGPFVANALGAATEGGLFGASQYVNEGESRLGNATTDALMGLGGSALIQGLGKGLSGVKNKIWPSAASIAQQVSPNLPAEELLARQRAAEGTFTPIGDILGSADLKKQFENRLVPGINSGGSAKLATLENQIVNKSENVLNSIGSKYAGENTDEITKQALTNAFGKQRTAKNDLYDSVNKIADREGFTLGLQEFTQKAGDSIDALQDSLVGRTDPRLKKLLNRVRNLDNEAYLLDNVSLKDAQMLSSSLAADAQKFAGSSAAGDRYTAGLLSDLSEALKKDIRNEVRVNGSKELQDALSNANKNYKDNFSGFLDKDIYKFLNEGKDADAIVRQIVRPSKTMDKATRINKIQKLLPEEDKNLLGYALLNKSVNSDGILDPRKVNNILNGLGDKQFKALFPDEKVRSELKDLQKLYSLNPEAMNRMFNPKTGARNVEGIGILSELLKGAIGGQIAGVPGAVAAASITSLRNRGLTNKFTSESFRNEVIDKALGKAAPKSAVQDAFRQNDFVKAMEVWLNDKRREK